VEMGGEEEDRLSLLPERIRETLSSLLLDNEGVVQPAILDQVVQMIRDKRSELREEGMSVVGGLVARALEQDFATGFRPEDTLSPWESERPSIALCKCASEDESALALLVSLSHHESSTGYFLLMFLLHHYSNQLSKYKDFTSQCATHPTLTSALVADLKVGNYICIYLIYQPIISLCDDVYTVRSCSFFICICLVLGVCGERIKSLFRLSASHIQRICSGAKAL
jgi:hypothetical protein